MLGYVNPINTSLEFDVTLSTYSVSANEIVRFQNNVSDTLILDPISFLKSAFVVWFHPT